MNASIEKYLNLHSSGRMSTHEFCLAVLSHLSSNAQVELQSLPENDKQWLHEFHERGFNVNCRSTSRFRPSAEQFEALAQFMQQRESKNAIASH